MYVSIGKPMYQILVLSTTIFHVQSHVINEGIIEVDLEASRKSTIWTAQGKYGTRGE